MSGEDELLRVVHGWRDASYLSVGSLVLLVYDYLITFQDEMDCFWTPSWTWTRVYFFLNRYISLACALIQVYRMVGRGGNERMRVVPSSVATSEPYSLIDVHLSRDAPFSELF
ncbi:hypothetical protein FS842_000760 [Serendipita sp. 407]|nr:hypothetical protein FS842_000760 [Serendipita sp. 407]